MLWIDYSPIYRQHVVVFAKRLAALFRVLAAHFLNGCSSLLKHLLFPEEADELSVVKIHWNKIRTSSPCHLLCGWMWCSWTFSWNCFGLLLDNTWVFGYVLLGLKGWCHTSVLVVKGRVCLVLNVKCILVILGIVASTLTDCLLSHQNWFSCPTNYCHACSLETMGSKGVHGRWTSTVYSEMS